MHPFPAIWLEDRWQFLLLWKKPACVTTLVSLVLIWELMTSTNNISNWARDNICGILAKIVAVFCPYLQKLPKTKLKSVDLIFFEEKISRQPNIDFFCVVTSNLKLEFCKASLHRITQNPQHCFSVKRIHPHERSPIYFAKEFVIMLIIQPASLGHYSENSLSVSQ